MIQEFYQLPLINGVSSTTINPVNVQFSATVAADTADNIEWILVASGF